MYGVFVPLNRSIDRSIDLSQRPASRSQPSSHPITDQSNQLNIPPHRQDIISLCFPDLEELRKIRALDFKGPSGPAASTGSALGTVVSQLGAQVAGMPSAPPSLVSTSSGAGAAGAAGAAWSTGSYTGGSAGTKGGFRGEFSTVALPDPNGTGRLFFVMYRCLPSGFGMRYDVGKRFPECLCFITKHPQAAPLFQQALQQVHALRLVYAPIDRIEWLLGGLHDRPALPVPGETLALKLPADAAHSHSRTYRFLWPTDGEAPVGDDALASLYLFQQLKPRGFLLLLSALLTEKRVCLVGTDSDKLAACAHAATALLYPFAWQHAFVPVLPPALLPTLVGGSPDAPIVFGLRRQHLPLLNQLQGPGGELLYVDLDLGDVSWTHEGPCPVPDIYVLPNTSQVVQAAQRLGAEAAKAAEKLDKAFSKGMAFLQKYTGQQPAREADEPKPDAANILAWELSLLAQSRASTPIVWPAAPGKGAAGARPFQAGGKGEKGLLNDEQQLRDALLVFYVNIAGDASTYLRTVGGGGRQLLFDRDFYIGSRGMLGDGPALSMLLLELVQTKGFERLAEGRKDRELRFLTGAASPRGPAAEAAAGAGSGPFLRCAEVLRARGETFAVKNIQRALKAQAQAQQQAAALAGGLEAEAGGAAAGAGVVDATAVGRWTVFHDTALQLTSNSANASADAQRALLSLVDDSFNAALLPSILRAIWSRLGDCKGLKWRHGHKALILLRELLLRGPEAILSETLSNITLLRSFLEYRGGMLGGAVGGGQGPTKVRDVARELFFLALDGRAFLLNRAGLQTASRKRLAPPRLRLTMEHALSSSFADIHRVVAPAAAAPDAAAATGSVSGASPRLGVPDLLSADSGITGDDGLLMMGGDALSAFTTSTEPGEAEEAAAAAAAVALQEQQPQPPQQAQELGAAQWETFPPLKTGFTPPRLASGSGTNSPLVQLSSSPAAAVQAVPAFDPFVFENEAEKRG